MKKNVAINPKHSALAEWSGAPANSPREGGAAGSDSGGGGSD